MKNKNFESFAQKLWFWRTNCNLFLGHPVCVPNSRSVLYFVWPGIVTQITTYTHMQEKLGISSTSCSPHVDFDQSFFLVIYLCKKIKCQSHSVLQAGGGTPEYYNLQICLARILMKSTLGGGCWMFTSVCKYPFRGGVIMFDRLSL